MSIYNPGRFKNGNEDRLIPIEGSIFTGVYVDRTDFGTRPEIRTSAERGFLFPLARRINLDQFARQTLPFTAGKGSADGRAVPVVAFSAGFSATMPNMKRIQAFGEAGKRDQESSARGKTVRDFERGDPE